jgi:hypothetical protein
MNTSWGRGVGRKLRGFVRGCFLVNLVGLVLDHRDGVLQRGNTGDRDPHRVACFEREWTRRDNTPAGQQD